MLFYMFLAGVRNELLRHFVTALRKAALKLYTVLLSSQLARTDLVLSKLTRKLYSHLLCKLVESSREVEAH